MSRKTEVYTWRVSPETKAGLEEAARTSGRSVAELLDQIVGDLLTLVHRGNESEIDVQRRLHARAARFAGCISSGTARSERVRELVRARLKRRHARAH